MKTGAIGLAAAVLLGGCTREAVPRESVPVNAAAVAATTPNAAASAGAGAGAANAGSAAVGTRLVQSTLADLPVTITLPEDWTMLGPQSDPGEGLVAFAPTGDVPTGASAFLDGSQVARVPPSLAKATAEALNRDECRKPGACAVLGSETLPPRGFLVSVRAPAAVYVEAWIAARGDRAVRCGYELSALHPPPGDRGLDEPGAVERARRQGERICGSLKTD